MHRRGQRVAILFSPLGKLTGFCLAVEYGTPERSYTMAALAACYGGRYDGWQRVASDALCARL
jgi:hypothetical protein